MGMEKSSLERLVMNPCLVLMEAGAMRCELRPDLGGCLSGLWFQDVPVLRSAPGNSISSVRQSANFPLVPFSNRLANARLVWEGESYEIAANFAPEAHAIHGLGWERSWQVLESRPASTRMALAHRPDAHGASAWPFAFECEQSFILRPDTLHVAMRFTNTDARTAPVGLGWHPYVVKRQGARIAFKADGMWETDSRSIPAMQVACPGLNVACDELEVNHVFEGVGGGVTLSDKALHVQITSDLSRLLVSTQPAKDFIALEPISHVPDAFNRMNHALLGTMALGSGQTWSACMTIQVRKLS